MEIDSKVLKQTAILIDLHFPLSLFLDAPIPFVRRLYWLPTECIAPHVFSFIRR